MVPDGGALLIGEHGEHVTVGNVMHYGLDRRSLVSHVWAAPLKSRGRLLNWWHAIRGMASTGPTYDRDAVFDAYLSEELIGSDRADG